MTGAQRGADRLFLEALLDLRTGAGLTLEDMADHLNASIAQVERWELGQDPVDVVLLRRWAEACGCSLLEFASVLETRLTGEGLHQPLQHTKH